MFKAMDLTLVAAAALVTALFKYTAVSSQLDLPERLMGLTQYLATGLMLIVVLVLAAMAGQVRRLRKTVTVSLVAGLAVVAVLLTLHLSGELARTGVTVECVDWPRSRILTPTAPSPDLARELVVAGGYESGWCDDPNLDQFRRMVEVQATGEAQKLQLWLVLAEVCFGSALALGLLLAAGRSGRSAN